MVLQVPLGMLVEAVSVDHIQNAEGVLGLLTSWLLLAVLIHRQRQVVLQVFVHLMRCWETANV